MMGYCIERGTRQGSPHCVPPGTVPACEEAVKRGHAATDFPAGRASALADPTTQFIQPDARAPALSRASHAQRGNLVTDYQQHEKSDKIDPCTRSR